MRRRWLLAGTLLLLLVAAGAGAVALRQALSPVAQQAPDVLFSVSPGEKLGTIATRLEREGLVRSTLAVKLLARWRDLASSLQTGEYRLSGALRPEEILERIAEGRVETYEVVLPEGLTQVKIEIGRAHV